MFSKLNKNDIPTPNSATARLFVAPQHRKNGDNYQCTELMRLSS